MKPRHVWSAVGLLGALAGIAVVVSPVAAQPGMSARNPNRMEPGVLAPKDESDYGVVPWAARMEPGVLSSSDELEPGLLGQGDPLFVRPSFPPPCRARCVDVLEPGVLGPQNELEPGLLGQGDPLFR